MLQFPIQSTLFRAQDQGQTPLHADVPVEIYLMSALDQPLQFEEGSPIGRTIAQLSAFAGPDARIQ